MCRKLGEMERWVTLQNRGLEYEIVMAGKKIKSPALSFFSAKSMVGLTHYKHNF
jgi:hypothetical protein